MDETNPQDENVYTKNLESLVKARTDQLQEVVRQNQRLLQCLAQIQSMDSLEQVREAAGACIKEFAPEPAPAPKFGGEPGEPVPEVDPDDLKALWQMGQEVQARHPGKPIAIGIEVMNRVCKPGANVEATCYRSTAIWMLSMTAPQRLAPWMKDGQIADAIFRAMASVPMEWMAVGVPRQGPPFDLEEVFRRLREQ